ncbi:MAG: hypothetical protein HQM08_29245 [Candidatus Riflebacteria bacterium]|nr:hypothetical protein [Candidatus Riflebacteria bacterium]
MYSRKSSFVLGFHGTDEELGLEILNGKKNFKPSENSYDWLGNGIYFWENNPKRAMDFAKLENKRNPGKVKKPFVLGAVLDLGNCFDLLSQEYIDFLQKAYKLLVSDLKERNHVLPENRGFSENDFDFKKRELDCAVIRYALGLAEKAGCLFDSVLSSFWEGKELYKNSGFKQFNHVQIAIRNIDCIKGVFLPRKKNDSV